MHSMTKQARIPVNTPDPPVNNPPIAAELLILLFAIVSSESPLAAHTHTLDNYESRDWRAEPRSSRSSHNILQLPVSIHVSSIEGHR